MNRIAVLLVMPLAVLLLGASKPKPEVSVKHDRFKSQTEVRGYMKSDRGAYGVARCDRPAIEWVAILPDTPSAESPQQFAFVTIAICDGWHYLQCHDVTVLADSNRVELGKQLRDGNVAYSSKVFEMVTVYVDRPTLADLSAASRIDLQQCRTEWLLTPEEKGLLASFIAKVEEVAPAAQASVTPAVNLPLAAPAASCTAEQRAAMVKLGLTVAQILAACPN